MVKLTLFARNLNSLKLTTRHSYGHYSDVIELEFSSLSRNTVAILLW